METIRARRVRRPSEALRLPDLYGLPEPGDRWEWVSAGAEGSILPLEKGLGTLFQILPGPVRVIGAAPSPQEVVGFDPQREALVAEGPGRWPAAGRVRLECVGTQPWTFRLEPIDEEGLRSNLPAESAGLDLDPEDGRILQAAVCQPPSAPDAFRVSLEAGRLSTVAGFDQLLGLPLVRNVERLEHQENTVRTVLRRFRGRALLCDEVGLGKTVEAGMVLLELLVRGLAQRVLILTPPSLVEQWKGEMALKFGLDFTAQDEAEFRAGKQEAWSTFPRVIASFHTAKRSPHREAVIAQAWDVVIVDEAHHFRNRRTLLWQMASQLRKNYILLLTATPVQNNLEELFNLVTLLDPGLLGTERRFAHRFVDSRDRMTPRNVDDLHRLLAEVMVRNRRSTIGFQFTRRIARTERVEPAAAERDLYQRVSRFVRGRLRAGGDPGSERRGLSRMALLTLQKELGSCPLAAAPTLERLAAGADLPEGAGAQLAALADAARTVGANAKAEALLRTVGDFADPMVVFTQFRQTQRYLAQRLADAGVATALFHGGLSRLQKEEAVESFRRQGGVLLSTDMGSEGRNLQFCHAVCNFDLSWNPMRIEQRIGRLSRIGQTRDVHVFNLVAAGTIEEAILHLLEAKINMFELVVGEVDMILGNWQDGEEEFEDAVTSLWLESEDHGEFEARMEDLGQRLRQARDAYLAQRAFDDHLFGDALQPR